MADEGSPSYRYVDDKIEQVDDKLNKLIQVHESDLTAQKKMILETQRYLARFEMDFSQMHVKSAISLTLSSPHSERVREYIVSQFTKATEALAKSDKPLSIALEFRKKCQECSDKYGLNAFVE